MTGIVAVNSAVKLLKHYFQRFDRAREWRDVGPVLTFWRLHRSVPARA